MEGGLASWNGAGKALENAGQSPQLSESAYQDLINSAPVVLVDFGASWCPPCKKMEPVLDQLQKENAGKFKLVKVDGGNDFDMMKAQKVEALPVFIIYKNGKEVWRKQGLTAKEEFLKFL
ncbi:MAG: thioredoxin family protein [Chitinophagaceae bacterium]|nr:thioredoxin family protein [Chitinophagaceae bacterium]